MVVQRQLYRDSEYMNDEGIPVAVRDDARTKRDGVAEEMWGMSGGFVLDAKSGRG